MQCKQEIITTKTLNNMATSSIIETALSILNGFDFHWHLGDDYAYTNGTRTRMQNKMREFVALADKCEETIKNALRALWVATYDYARCTSIFRNPTKEETTKYEAKKAELMEIIYPSMSIAA